MQLKHLLPLALGAGASAQNLAEALASQNSSLSSLNALLASQPAIVSTLSNATNITILAPNNDALTAFVNSTAGAAAASNADAVAALLTYHVLQGNYAASAFTNTSQFIPTALNASAYSNVTGGQRVEARLNGSSVDFFTGLLQESQVVTANISFTGGTIHIINKVLTIPTTPANTATSLNLTSLAGALTQANLVNTVDSLRDITIFAPSNAAFQAIGSVLGNLSTEQLASVLTYHVVNGTVGYSSGLTNTTLTTVGGGQITIRIENGSIFANSATVITPDVLVANGVVHVIDGVLNPNNTSAAPPSSGASTTTGAFTGASSVTSVPFTSGVTASTTVTSTPSRSPTSSSSSGGAVHGMAMPTGAVGMGALFGGAAVLMGQM
ncbi:related to TGF beta induced protein ig-h3 precursor [Phialocephala subalpina]|uniref:Related to TGF beta induced protein ig-h3 n=1 Tax=Phialocephala subalpina TaxID=576137 RepID=A0A1L7WYC6_9HELO|nr:related to TGF beta induced protein ig-h3 precursor [Phialocephala subalpina]